jgi:small-conductance mechanosensitive channel
MANRLFPSSCAIHSELRYVLPCIKWGCLHALWSEPPLQSFLVISAPKSLNFLNKQICTTLFFWNLFYFSVDQTSISLGIKFSMFVMLLFLPVSHDRSMHGISLYFWLFWRHSALLDIINILILMAYLRIFCNLFAKTRTSTF